MRNLIWFDEVQKAVCDGCAKQFATLPCESSDCQIQEALVHVLPVDAAPVRRGVWIFHQHEHFRLLYNYICSECGCDYTSSDYNFCPNCGADMRGETDETD